MWGFSEALDLLEEYARARDKFPATLNILLVGSIDSRHVLKTMAQRLRHGDVQVTYYICDLAMELVARQILLLIVALEPPDRFGFVEKARLWMEVYGNTMVRPATARYLIHKAVQMIHMVTNRDFLQKRMPCIDLALLRYKEKDHLENIFKYWKLNRDSTAKVWDQNLRRHLGTRYDAKMGVFDWDYNMKLLDIETGKRVCMAEYKHWRNTGIAYTWLETEVSVGNPTLQVGVGVCGDELFSRGYLGDMESGPYFGFGTDCGEEAMLETRNGFQLRRATDVTERHLQRIFIELETGSPPADSYSSDLDLGLLRTVPPAVPLEDKTPLEFNPDKSPEEYGPVLVEGHRVVFLPANFLQTQLTKDKYRELFDMVYVAHNFFQFLSEDILNVLKPNTLALIETRKFVIAFGKKIGDFGEEVRKKMAELGGNEISQVDFIKDSLARFELKVSSCNESKNDESSGKESFGPCDEIAESINDSRESGQSKTVTLNAIDSLPWEETTSNQ